MPTKRLNTCDPPEHRISWSIYTLAVVIFGLLGTAVVTSDVLSSLFGGAWFWIALVLGGTVLVINLTRPSYENAGEGWRYFYDVLLRQMGPPDLD